MDERMSGDIENLLDEKLKPIKNDINSLISEINNIKNLLGLKAYINITGGPITVGSVEDIISEGFFREKD